MTVKPMHRARGVSLVEALVALAVMAFGMLGIAGLQSSLRQNTDVAKQRAEAVRLAQQSIEQARAYSVVNVTAGKRAYDNLLASTTVDTVAGTNTSFTRTVTVPAIAAGQLHKVVTVDVNWTDRTGTVQRVTLATTVHRSAPELAGALLISGVTVPQLPGGRHPLIPRNARDLGNGTSSFTPPGAAGGRSWTFVNATGLISQICDFSVCTTLDARLLAGYVSFATGSTAPTWVESETPSSGAQSVGIDVVSLTPVYPGSPECYTEMSSFNVAYYCLIQVNALASVPSWSGRAEVTGLPLATSVADPDASSFRVCRYTLFRNHNAVGSGNPAITNADHPYSYVNVTQSLGNQNFLVIRAGDGTNAFACPDDDGGSSTPYVNGSTWHHQPAL